MVKNPPDNAGDIRHVGLISESRRPCAGGWGNLLIPGESHGQRSLVAVVHRAAENWTQLK